MNETQIKIMQERVGAEPDGFWGPRSVAACQRHLRKMMPSPHPFPRQDQKSLTSFYGPAGKVPLVRISCPYRMSLYNGPETVKTIQVHERLGPSLERVFKELGKRYRTDDARTEAGVNRFFGVYAN